MCSSNGADLGYGADVGPTCSAWWRGGILAGDAAGPVLELGGGTGPLARELAGHGVPVVVADLAGLLSQAPRPAVRTGGRAGVRAAAADQARRADLDPVSRLAAEPPGQTRPGNIRRQRRVCLS
jgi:hypothetical protein